MSISDDRVSCFLGGLTLETTETELQSALEEIGPIQRLKIVRDKDNGRSRRYSFFITKENTFKKFRNSKIHVRGATLEIKLSTKSVNEVENENLCRRVYFVSPFSSKDMTLKLLAEVGPIKAAHQYTNAGQSLKGYGHVEFETNQLFLKLNSKIRKFSEKGIRKTASYKGKMYPLTFYKDKDGASSATKRMLRYNRTDHRSKNKRRKFSDHTFLAKKDFGNNLCGNCLGHPKRKR